MTKLGQHRRDPLTGERGMVRKLYSQHAICVTSGRRLFKWFYSEAVRKRMAQGRYRA